MSVSDGRGRGPECHDGRGFGNIQRACAAGAAAKTGNMDRVVAGIGQYGRGDDAGAVGCVQQIGTLTLPLIGERTGAAGDSVLPVPESGAAVCY